MTDGALYVESVDSIMLRAEIERLLARIQNLEQSRLHWEELHQELCGRYEADQRELERLRACLFQVQEAAKDLAVRLAEAEALLSKIHSESWPGDHADLIDAFLAGDKP